MKEKKFKCKACGVRAGVVDLRLLCSHCAFKIDTADARACDINGIREDMWAAGIPTSGFTRGGSSVSDWMWNEDLHLAEEEEEDGKEH